MTLRKRITTVIAAALLIAMTTVSASAQYRYRISEREDRSIAYRNGFQFGLREGRFDRRNGNRFDFKQCHAYKDGRIGYRNDYRHDGNYRDGFRDGFESGYRDGFRSFRGSDRRDDNRHDRDDNDWWRRSRRY
ncbi:MAG: hypothetical protein L0220_04175 [Acidobacteria bacterium]|nr:hypothetical protein [Acidobacteriota bacterium]